jgi:hypothetical protein
MPKVAFKQADAQRLIRAAKAEGLDVEVVFDPKTGELRMRRAVDQVPAGAHANPLDERRAKRAGHGPQGA